MRASVLAAILSTACLLCSPAPAQESAQFQKYKVEAQNGNAEAQHKLGVSYGLGQGVAEDSVEAVKWYRKAAERNYARAQASLGACYDLGQGVAEDSVQAVKWYRKAAERNHAKAQHNLGVSYAAGKGVEKDYAEAYAYFNLAAKTLKLSGKARDDLEKNMSPQQVAEAQQRTKVLRAQIETNLPTRDK